MVNAIVSWFDIIVLSVVEGITEFLPVSSTGHMIIASKLLGLPEGDQALEAFLIIVQAGAILAVVTIFWPLLLQWLRSWFSFFGKESRHAENLKGRKQSLAVALSVVPFAVIGFVLHDFVKSLFSVQTVAYALISGGILILLSEWFFKNQREENLRTPADYNFWDSFWVGLGQCGAMWPGFSRAAATLIAARFRGFSREAAAEVSFLVGFPTLFGTASYEAFKEYKVLDASWIGYLAVGTLISWAVAYVCVKGFVAFLRRYSMNAFAYYRIVVGLVLLIWLRA